MPIESASSQPVLQRVVVAMYEHRHGIDVRAFTHQGEAMSWRTKLAKRWWHDAFDDEPPADDEIGEEYFGRMLERDEFFSTQECEVEGDSWASAGAMPADAGDTNSFMPKPASVVSP